jgi:hypothetical protein
LSLSCRKWGKYPVTTYSCTLNHIRLFGLKIDMEQSTVDIFRIELDPEMAKTCVTIGPSREDQGCFYLVLEGRIVKLTRSSERVYAHETINEANWGSTRTCFCSDGFVFAATATNLYRVLEPRDY